MEKLWNILTEYISRHAIFFWVLSVVAIFLFCSYIAWQNHISNVRFALAEQARDLSYLIDNFVNTAFLEIQPLPDYKKGKPNCKRDFYPYLRHIIINHPQISGIAIHDINHNITCSTLPKNKSFLLGKNTSAETIIAGPYELKLFDHPFFSLKRTLGNYQIELIISSKVFENLLKTSETNVHLILLYNQAKKQITLEAEHTKEGSWSYTKSIDSKRPNTIRPIYASSQLRSINNESLIIIPYAQILFENLWYHQILLALDILIISYFSFVLIKKFLHAQNSLEFSIKKAIKHKQFYPVYQPLFNTDRNCFSGVEVLLRWQDKHNEVIMPSLFIKEAEATGLIVPITLQIIEIAFKEIKDILTKNSQFHLSFNICAPHFTDPSFFEQFYELISVYSVCPDQLMLEITERDLIDENNELYTLKMQELRDKGISLAVDDYGTGHASICYLQYFPFNYLKIDKLFIHAIGTKAITESLNDAIIDLAKKINLIIIAEGVETKEQVNYLLKNGIQLLQGWYFSKALSIEQLKSLLHGGKNEL